MYNLRIASLLGLLAVFALQTLAHPTARAPTGKAVYLITNDEANAVLALPIRNGLLAAGSMTQTGGAGASGITSSTNQPAGPDALFSQSSLTIAGTNLFAVNAGSNSLTMFTIDNQDPTRLTMVGQPVAIPGDFPTTVAASARHGLVCVGTTGAKAGVSCSTFSAQGLGPMDNLRPFNLGQSTPPSGPLNTVSQVFFSGDESALYTTVKGDPTKNNTGFLASFTVQGKRSCQGQNVLVARDASQVSPAGTAVLFGTSTIPGTTDLFATDASFGAVVLDVQKNGTVGVKGKGMVSGQMATCWSAVSPATNTAFVTDVGLNRLVEMSLTDASVQGEIDLSANGDPGLIDLRAAGNFVYALSPGNGTTQAAITVVDATSKMQVQHFSLQSMGAGKSAQGMAVL